MLNLKKDAKCIELENYLNDYVAKTNNYWKMRRKHFAEGGSEFDVYNNTSEALKEVQNASDNFSNGLGSYLQSFASTQDKQQVAGRFLWKIIKKCYTNHDFKSEGVALCSSLFNQLSDDQKIKFLELLFEEPQKDKKYKNRSALWLNFDDTAILKLMNFAPNQNISAVKRLYTKTLTHLATMPKKSESLNKKIKMLSSMFESFARNIDEITPDAVVKYVDIYYQMSEKTNQAIEYNPLLVLCQKTPYAKNLAKQSASSYAFDKETIKACLKKYVEHVNSPANKDFNNNLAKQVNRLIQKVSYTTYELEELIDIIEPKKTQRKGQKHDGLTKIANILRNRIQIHKDKKHPFAIIDPREPKETYDDKVVNYAKALFQNAQEYQNINGYTASLYELLTANGEINKPLLLKVVDAYGETIRPENIDRGKINFNFHRQISNMLQNIVTEYDYSPKDLAILKKHIQQGANQHDEFEYLGMVVKNAPTLADDWRAQMIKTKKLEAISLR